MRCVGVDPDTFLADYWSQQPLLAPAAARSRQGDGGPSGFTDLLSPADVDELVTDRGLRQPFFRVVRDGSTLGGTTRSGVAGGRRITDLADPDRLREHYADGATLALQALHRLHPPLKQFCRELAIELGHPTQANAYITPPGSRGFAPHHDTHDVFVLQVDGTKHWHVYAPVLPLPLPSQPSSDLVGPDGQLLPDGAEPVLSVVLGPGDALYVPRGFPHAAETNDDRSLHLTIGVLGVTRYDVVQDTLRLAADEVELRRSLPVHGSATVEPAGDEAAELLRALQEWVGRLSVDDIRPLLRRRMRSAVPVEPVGMLAADAAARALSPDSCVRLRHGLVAHVEDGDPGRVELHLPDRTIDLPASTAAALKRLLAGHEVQVGELADVPRPDEVSNETPEGLDADDCVVLVRRLLREGALAPVPATARRR